MTRRANLMELAKERGVAPILLLETLLREGWRAPEDAQDLTDHAGQVTIQGEQAAYQNPESVVLEIGGCEALYRLAVVAEDLLPPGIDRQGRPAANLRLKRARFARAMLERSALLLDGKPQAALGADALAVGFREAAARTGAGRLGKQACLLGEQLAKLCEGPLGGILPPKGAAEWVGLLLDAADAWTTIAEVARERAEAQSDGRERAILQGLADGWLLEASRLQAAVRGYAGGARA